jgi:hypothetical protein
MYEGIGRVIREACAAGPLEGQGVGHSSGLGYEILAVRLPEDGWLATRIDGKGLCETLTSEEVAASGLGSRGLKRVLMPEPPFGELHEVWATWLCDTV